MTRGAGAALAVLVVVLAACGGEHTPAPTITVTYRVQGDAPAVELSKRLVAEYTSAHPAVRIEPVDGDDADVLTLDDDVLRAHLPGRRVAPLDPAAFGKASTAAVEVGYVRGTLDGAKGPDQRLYGVPSELTGVAFAINRQHFVDAGLDPSRPPQTWQQVLDAARALGAAGHKRAFGALSPDSGFRTLASQTGGTLLSPDGRAAQLDSPANAEALRTWVRLARGSDPAAGTPSMAIVEPRTMAQIRASDPGTFGELTLVPLPRMDAARPAVDRVHGRFWAVNAASSKQAEAWRFVAFLAGRHERWLAEAGVVQPVAGWERCATAQSLPFVDVAAAAIRNGRFDPVTPHWAEVRAGISTAVDDALRGASPSDTLRKANTALQRTLG